MVTTSTEVLHLPLDKGSAIYVQEHVAAEGVAATISKLTYQTSLFMGAEMRREYISFPAADTLRGLGAVVNKVPECSMLWQEVKETPDIDEMVQFATQLAGMFGETITRPGILIQPGWAFACSSYKTAQGVRNAMSGHYLNDDYITAKRDRKTDKESYFQGLEFVTYEDFGRFDLGHTYEDLSLVDVEVDVIKEIQRILRLWDKMHDPGMYDMKEIDRLTRLLHVTPTLPDWAVPEMGVDVRGRPILVSEPGKSTPVKQSEIAKYMPDYQISNEQLAEFGIKDRADPKDPKALKGLVGALDRHMAALAKAKLYIDAAPVPDATDYPSMSAVYNGPDMEIYAWIPTDTTVATDWSKFIQEQYGRGRAKSDTSRPVYMGPKKTMNALPNRSLINKLGNGAAGYVVTYDGLPVYCVVAVDPSEKSDRKVKERIRAALTEVRKPKGREPYFAPTAHPQYVARSKSFVEGTARIINARNLLARRQVVLPAFAERLNELVQELVDYAPNGNLRHLLTHYGDMDLTDAGKPITERIDGFRAIQEAWADYRSRFMPLASSGMEAALDGGYTLVGWGRYAPRYSDRHESDPTHVESFSLLLPVTGYGVAPVLYKRKTDGAAATYGPDSALEVSVMLDAPAVTLTTPLQPMIYTALLYRLVQYLLGSKHPAGIAPVSYEQNPTGAGISKPAPLVFLERQLAVYQQALAQELQNSTPDTIKGLLAKVQQVQDASLFLRHPEHLIDIIVNRDDWSYYLQSILVATSIGYGATVSEVEGRAGSVRTIAPGIVPEEVAKFLFSEVMADVIKLDSYKECAKRARNIRRLAPEDLSNPNSMNRVIYAHVMLERMRNGLDLLETLLDGSNEWASVLRTHNTTEIRYAQYANKVVKAISKVARQNYLGLMDTLEYETPWRTATWKTSWASLMFSVKGVSIPYMAYDVTASLAEDSKMAALSSALIATGFDWYEIAPEAAVVYHASEHLAKITGGYMKGYDMTDDDDHRNRFLNNAPIGHQGLKLTTAVPMYDREAYNELYAYAALPTERTYFPEPVGNDLSALLQITAHKEFPSWLNAAMGDEAERMKVWQFEKNPALAKCAVIIPFINAFNSVAPVTRPLTQLQLMDVATDDGLMKAGRVMTEGTLVVPTEHTSDLLDETNGIPVVLRPLTTASTPLPWVGFM